MNAFGGIRTHISLEHASTITNVPMSILDRVASGGVADHYDGAKDEEVVLQIIGGWPSATIPVDESGARRCLKNSYGKAKTQPYHHGGGDQRWPTR